MTLTSVHKPSMPYTDLLETPLEDPYSRLFANGSYLNTVTAKY